MTRAKALIKATAVAIALGTLTAFPSRASGNHVPKVIRDLDRPSRKAAIAKAHRRIENTRNAFIRRAKRRKKEPSESAILINKMTNWQNTCWSRTQFHHDPAKNRQEMMKISTLKQIVAMPHWKRSKEHVST